MNPWREKASDDLEVEASNLLARAGQPPAWTAARRKSVWQRIEASADGCSALWPGVGWKIPAALAGLAVLYGLALVHGRSPSHPSVVTAQAGTIAALPKTAPTDSIAVELGAVGRLRVRPNTTYRLPSPAASEYRIKLENGELCAEIAHRDPSVQKPLLIQTSQFEVFVIGTRFCVDAREGFSSVAVSEGRVRVQGSSGAVFVGAGEMLASNDLRLSAPPPPTPAPAPAPVIRAMSREPRSRPDSSTVAVARPDAPNPGSLGEQNALYALGVQARDRQDGAGALAAWRSYLQEFPRGILAPEASAGVLTELVGQGRNDEALAAADSYLASFPADGRAAEVAFIRGNLLHEKLGRTADALDAYRKALALATRPRLRDDALFAVGACQRMLGHAAEARAAFERYQVEFPHGAHSSELSRWLSQ